MVSSDLSSYDFDVKVEEVKLRKNSSVRIRPVVIYYDLSASFLTPKNGEKRRSSIFKAVDTSLISQFGIDENQNEFKVSSNVRANVSKREKDLLAFSRSFKKVKRIKSLGANVHHDRKNKNKRKLQDYYDHSYMQNERVLRRCFSMPSTLDSNIKNDTKSIPQIEDDKIIFNDYFTHLHDFLFLNSKRFRSNSCTPMSEEKKQLINVPNKKELLTPYQRFCISRTNKSFRYNKVDKDKIINLNKNFNNFFINDFIF